MEEFKHFKKYTDSTMLSWSKKELIEHIHILLHNWETCAETKDRVINLNKKLKEEVTTPVVHAHWEKAMIVWKCSSCKVPVSTGRPMCAYCPNCGAKMDGDNNA